MVLQSSLISLYLFLKKFTDNVIYFIPDRFSQGYGVNKGAIDSKKLKKRKIIWFLFKHNLYSLLILVTLFILKK